MSRIETIETAIAPHREALTNHRIYQLLSEVDDIKIFMEKHVYAVWDFMSLLKALQNHLTCTSIPWKPAKNPKIARFINEIVWGEESDINEKKEPKSHFEMYVEAMEEVDADPQKILKLIDKLETLDDWKVQSENARLRAAEKRFMDFTFETIQTNEPHKIAAAFTFGREDLIPDLFIEILNQSSPEGKANFPKLIYYLERHIEVDGDEHGPLSLEMIEELCGNDDTKWEDVKNIAKQALDKRIELWDEIASEVEATKMELSMV